jgi:hypothetical protein
MKSSQLMISIAVIVSAVVLTLGLVIAAFAPQLNLKAMKHQAIDGCFEVAKGADISGSLEKNGWTVEKSNVNNDIYNDCMKKKGY